MIYNKVFWVAESISKVLSPPLYTYGATGVNSTIISISKLVKELKIGLSGSLNSFLRSLSSSLQPFRLYGRLSRISYVIYFLLTLFNASFLWNLKVWREEVEDHSGNEFSDPQNSYFFNIKNLKIGEMED